MSKTYKVRVSNDDHRYIQKICDVINAHRPPDLPRWEPENMARFLVVRGLDMFEDASVVQRFFLLTDGERP